jgi:hypothetical protein
LPSTFEEKPMTKPSPRKRARQSKQQHRARKSSQQRSAPRPPTLPDTMPEVDPEGLISLPAARKRFLGEVSAVTVWRWRHDPQSGFPAVTTIEGRHYVRKGELLAWLAERTKAAAAAA